MTRKEFDEIKGIALEMKPSGQIEVLETNPIVVVGPLECVTIEQPYVHAPIAPCRNCKSATSQNKE